MAKRMKSKIQPAVQTLTFSTDTIPAASQGVAGTADFYIDLSQCASLVNRRFYRQGLNWAVSSIKIISGGFEGYVIVKSLPNTWVMSNAWEKSFRAWQHMIKNATEESGSQSVKGKFLDFKIYADADHHNDGFNRNLLPIDGKNNTFADGQWQASQVELPSTDVATPGQSYAYELIAVGDNAPAPNAQRLPAKGMILGYASSRALPSQQDPNVPDDASDLDENWMLNLFNDGTRQDSDVVQMLETTGDNPPYPFENDKLGNTDTMYPGGQNNAPGMHIHDYNTITSTTIGSETMSKGGNFPCGLIKLSCGNTTSSAHNISIQVNLVPGNHRGYLAESMTEM